MTIAYIVEIIFLCWSMYRGFAEYNGTTVEAIGLNMVITCGVAGSGALLFGLYGVLKWKSLDEK
jgi:hypothetical protein